MAQNPPPATIWLPDAAPPNSSPAGSSTFLPGWAVDRIRGEFAARSGRTSRPLLHVTFGDAEPGMDARAHCDREERNDTLVDCQEAVLLAELHPDGLSADRELGPGPGALDEGWPGFFHRAHRLLRRGGLLLVATAQRRTQRGLTDPLGTLTACARSAGFTYLQHLVIVHGRPAGDRLIPHGPEGASPGLTHSDLLVYAPAAAR